MIVSYSRESSKTLRTTSQFHASRIIFQRPTVGHCDPHQRIPNDELFFHNLPHLFKGSVPGTSPTELQITLLCRHSTTRKVHRRGRKIANSSNNTFPFFLLSQAHSTPHLNTRKLPDPAGEKLQQYGHFHPGVGVGVGCMPYFTSPCHVSALLQIYRGERKGRCT